jgi:hypothetical protein
VRRVAAVALGASLLLLRAVLDGRGEPDDLVADRFELENLAADPAMRPVLDDRRTRLRELCSPALPGFGDRSGTSVPIALAVLGGLVLVESVASRRTRHPRRAPG